MERKNLDLNRDIKDFESKQTELQTDYNNILRENELLKNELKRLGELTSDKILDLENNINSIGRMKEFQKENFVMEKEKIQNSSEFVIE